MGIAAPQLHDNKQVATYIITEGNAFSLIMGCKTADLHASANKFMLMDTDEPIITKGKRKRAKVSALHQQC